MPAASPDTHEFASCRVQVDGWVNASSHERTLMALTAEDRAEITELISMHGHLVDAGELDRLHELFTADVTYDVTDLGAASLEGLAAIREAALALGELNPVGHHVTNIVLTQLADDRVRALSKESASTRTVRAAA